MTFSSQVKEEIARYNCSKLECISELSAIIRNNATVNDNIKISIENNITARRIFKLFKDIYDISPKITVRKKYNFTKNLSYILEINSKVAQILMDLSIKDKDNYLNIPKDYIVSDQELIRSYLRGLFLSTGSVNDPKTSRYHLEIIVNNNEYAIFVSDLINNFNLNSKVLKREKNYMIYIKEAEKISDFLRIIYAYNAVLYFEDIRIYRDHKNMTNRLNNCEQANIDKIFFTSSSQIKDIEKLKELDIIDLLDDKLKIAIEYRLKYPESSLQELSEIISLETKTKITKSGLNHRFRKIKEIITNMEVNNEKKNNN